MSEGPHHSIGEVLSLLKAEHEDVTISKIRFLESQGLISPERTPSGYRKFYESDIDRLRWILTQQRDNFLPLKVIKRRLAEEGFDPTSELEERPVEDLLPEPSLFTDAEVLDPGTVEADAVTDPASDEAQTDEEEADEVEVNEAEATEMPESPPVVIPAAGSVSLTAGELAEASGTDLGLVGEMEKMGLIAAMPSDQGSIYDHEALLTARAAAAFIGHGMEVRHLRMFKVAADREAGLFQQLRAAALAKGGATAAGARAELTELMDHGDSIRRSLLRRELGLSSES